MDHISTFLQASDLSLASAIPVFRSTILLLATAAVALVAYKLIMNQFPDFAFKVRAAWRTIRLQFTPVRFKAPLTDVVCQVCRKGTAILDPIYLQYKGDAYIEGNCNCCGAYIRARLHP